MWYVHLYGGMYITKHTERKESVLTTSLAYLVGSVYAQAHYTQWTAVSKIRKKPRKKKRRQKTAKSREQRKEGKKAIPSRRFRTKKKRVLGEGSRHCTDSMITCFSVSLLLDAAKVQRSHVRVRRALLQHISVRVRVRVGVGVPLWRCADARRAIRRVVRVLGEV